MFIPKKEERLKKNDLMLKKKEKKNQQEIKSRESRSKKIIIKTRAEIEEIEIYTVKTIN